VLAGMWIYVACQLTPRSLNSAALWMPMLRQAARWLPLAWMAGLQPVRAEAAG
jgi:hypothetical protein